MEVDQDELVGLRELARRLRVPLSWLKLEADEGRIPSLLAGRRRLFSTRAVMLALLARAAASPGSTG